MAKCSGCAKYIKATEAPTCNRCSKLFHRVCASLPPTGSVAPTWCCPRCRNKNSHKPCTTPQRSQVDEEERFMSPSPTGDISPSQLMSSSSTGDITPALLLSFKEEMREMFREELRAELRMIREELSSIRGDMQQLQMARVQMERRLDGMDTRIGALELNVAAAHPSAEIAQLKEELNDRDQLLMANDVELSNLPESSGENLNHTIMLVATKIGVTLDERDIVSADRVGARRVNATSSSGPVETRPRPIIVRLARRDLRDELMRAARVRRGVSTADLNMPGPPRRFYINERLTKQNRLLFRRARELAQRHSWQYVWTRHGRILARRKPGDKTTVVRNDENLGQISSPIAHLSS